MAERVHVCARLHTHSEETAEGLRCSSLAEYKALNIQKVKGAEGNSLFELNPHSDTSAKGRSLSGSRYLTTMSELSLPDHKAMLSQRWPLDCQT